jgi:hypothetical protein
MSRRQELHRKAEEAARRDKRRLVSSALGLVLCLVVVWMLTKRQRAENSEFATEQTPVLTDLRESLPKPDMDKLASVKDATEAEQVILEPEAFAELSRLGRNLFASWLYLLGEPAFPFDAEAAEKEAVRGQPFRLRATLLDGRSLRRGVGLPEEYWCLLRTDDGQLVHYVAMNPPEELFGSENFVLADGYYFKQYRQRVEEEWLSAPLFVGRILEPSFREAEPTATPDLGLLAGVRDQPLGTHNDPRLVDEEPGLWHLLNVARTVKEDSAALAALQAEATMLDYETLEALSRDPELFRGRLFKLGGMVREAATVRARENPLRAREISSAWTRNDMHGDTLLHLKAAGEFDFQAGKGPVEYHGFFLMLWSYVDTQGQPRRVPVFAVTDADVPVLPTPPFANQMAFIFIGLAVAIGGLMYLIVQRDRKRNEAAMKALVEKRAARRRAKANGSGPEQA